MWGLIYLLVELYLLCLLVRIVLSWFPNVSGGLESIQRVLIRITEPLLAPIRALLPPVRFGGGALDLSPMIVFFVLILLLGALPR